MSLWLITRQWGLWHVIMAHDMSVWFMTCQYGSWHVSVAHDISVWLMTCQCGTGVALWSGSVAQWQQPPPSGAPHSFCHILCPCSRPPAPLPSGGRVFTAGIFARVFTGLSAGFTVFMRLVASLCPWPVKLKWFCQKPADWEHSHASCARLPRLVFPCCAGLPRLVFPCCVGLPRLVFPCCVCLPRLVFPCCAGLPRLMFPCCACPPRLMFPCCACLPRLMFPWCACLPRLVFHVVLASRDLCSHGVFASREAKCLSPTLFMLYTYNIQHDRFQSDRQCL